MKFELRNPKYDFQNKVDKYLELYITKNEFKKSFESSKEECHKEFSTCVEMYTSPHCFECYPEIDFIESIYNNLKSTSKGIILGISQNEDDDGCQRRHLFCGIV